MSAKTKLLKKITWLFIFALVIVVFWDWLNAFQVSDVNNAGLQISQFLPVFQQSQHKPASAMSSENLSTSTESRKKAQKHKTSLITTTNCVKPYFLLILVLSAPSNVKRRTDIRQTWGVDTALKPQWRTVFLVARIQQQSKMELMLKAEDEIFGDLVRADYDEHYWNLTLKVQMGFEWAARYCKFSFLLKIDDDVFVNTKSLISFLSNPNTPNEKLYMGHLYQSAPVPRSGKFKVSLEEYNRTNYPDFCPGFGYILSFDVVDLFVELLHVVPKFRMEDVYVGMLANQAGVKAVHNSGFIVGPDRVTECILHDNTLVWHGIFEECLFKVYSQTLTNRQRK